MDVESRPMTENSNEVFQSTVNSICALDGLSVADTIDGLAEALAHLSISKDGQPVRNLEKAKEKFDEAFQLRIKQMKIISEQQL